MWSSRRIAAISIPIFAASLLLSLRINLLAIIFAAVLGIHLLSLLLGFLRIRLRLCPRRTAVLFSGFTMNDRSLAVDGDKIYTRSRISSTIYIVRGYVAPRRLFLYPLLLCVLTYFKPLYMSRSQYLVIGSAPHFIYVFKSRIGSQISREDEQEIARVIDSICTK